EHLSEASTTTQAPVAAVPRRRRSYGPLAAAYGGGILTAFAALVFLSAPPLPDQSSYRFTPLSFASGGQSNAVWSPDCKAVAYATGPQNEPDQIFIRYLDSPIPAQVTHISEDAWPVAWAPDGKRIIFRSNRSPRGCGPSRPLEVNRYRWWSST